jgi:hypothetical protein
MSQAEHVRRISLLLLELTALEASKATVDEERRHLLAAASKQQQQQVLDDFQLASLTGLRPVRVRKMTRGVLPQQRSNVPAHPTGISSP